MNSDHTNENVVSKVLFIGLSPGQTVKTSYISIRSENSEFCSNFFERFKIRGTFFPQTQRVSKNVRSGTGSIKIAKLFSACTFVLFTKLNFESLPNAKIQE